MSSGPSDFDKGLRLDPRAGREILKARLFLGEYSYSYIVGVSVLIALYTLICVLTLGGFLLRWYSGRLWIVRREGTGNARRLNAAVVTQFLLGVYAAMWIALLFSVSANPAPPLRGGFALQILVFLPLSASAWVQVYGMVTTLPSRQSLLNLSGSTRPNGRLARLLGNRSLLNILVIALPIVSDVAQIPIATIASGYEMQAYNRFKVVDRLIGTAVANGWTDAAFNRSLGILNSIHKQQKMVSRLFKVAAIPYLFWSIVILGIYGTCAFIVLRLLNRQISHLRQSVAHTESLNGLTTMGPIPNLLPVPEKPATYRVTLPKRSETPLPAYSHSCLGLSGCCAGEVDGEGGGLRPTVSRQPEFEQDLRLKLCQLVGARRIFLLQVGATLFMTLATSIVAAFAVNGAFFRLDRTHSRIINVFVPGIGFLLPGIPCALVFVHRSRSTPQRDPFKRPQNPAPVIDEGEFEPAPPKVGVWNLPRLDEKYDGEEVDDGEKERGVRSGVREAEEEEGEEEGGGQALEMWMRSMWCRAGSEGGIGADRRV